MFLKLIPHTGLQCFLFTRYLFFFPLSYLPPHPFEAAETLNPPSDDDRPTFSPVLMSQNIGYGSGLLGGNPKSRSQWNVDPTMTGDPVRLPETLSWR